MNEQTNPEMLPEEPEQEEPQAEVVEVVLPAFDIGQVKRVLEAALLSSTEPLTVLQLKRLFGGQVDADNLRKVLDELKGEWAERSIELSGGKKPEMIESRCRTRGDELCQLDVSWE